MVYCGKASQGCQNCRTRRIKCDKVRPDCSQCIRVGKKCPGYRDQLSLMFRDESSKVMQKAHASWGVDAVDSGSSRNRQDSFNAGSPSSSKSPNSSSAPFSTPTSPGDDEDFNIPGLGSFPVTLTNHRTRRIKSEFPPPQPKEDDIALIRGPVAPSTERGLQFFLRRYIIGLPDIPSAATPSNLPDWLWHPTSQAIMTAVGLAGLGNINDDPEIQADARRSYGFALRQTRGVVSDPSQITSEVAVRAAVFLALFEVVKKATDDPTNTAQAHILGAGAMMKTVLSKQQGAPTKLSMMGLVQLAYSMLVPCYNAGTSPPTAYFDWMKLTGSGMSPEHRGATDLLPILASLLQVLAMKKGTVLVDGTPRTSKMFQEVLKLDAQMRAWEEGRDGDWDYTTIEDNNLPPQATFCGRFHVYANMWHARLWNHYRWGRILLNQLILSLLSDCPVSGLAAFGGNNSKAYLGLKKAEQSCTETIYRISEDMLTSIPAHWPHPVLTANQRVRIDGQNITGAGAVGIPTMLHHIMTAACAPGVPHSWITWGIQTLEAIWGTLGMSMAKNVKGILEKHLDNLQRRGSEDSGVYIKAESVC